MYSGERGRTTVLRHMGRLQKDEEREGDQRPLGEEPFSERERNKAGWKSWNVAKAAARDRECSPERCRPYAPTGAGRLDGGILNKTLANDKVTRFFNLLRHKIQISKHIYD